MYKGDFYWQDRDIFPKIDKNTLGASLLKEKSVYHLARFFGKKKHTNTQKDILLLL